MRSTERRLPWAVLALAMAAIVAVGVAPATATTLIRAGLEELTAANDTIVLGEVLEAHSYWNDEGTFIFTDVKVRVDEILKGQRDSETVTVTLLGGTVGEVSTLVLGVASLEPGSSYLLFLNEEELPGARRHLTVRDHCQGAFDIVAVDGLVRARSQARDFGLLPDAVGTAQPPGGPMGLELGELMLKISKLAADGVSGGLERRIP